MLRSAASKVMWVGRATVFLVGLAVILALLFGVATAALGANGQNFILGQLNKATAVTQLNGNVSGGPALRVNNTNTAAGSRALQLGVAQNKPPLAVNATAGKATNLNADKVDGKEAADFASATLFGSAVESQISDNFGLDCTMGEVRLFAGRRAPKGWAPAEGQLMPITQNTALFSLLENRYGGNGVTTFALPDLRGAEPKGVGPAAPFYVICVTGVFP